MDAMNWRKELYQDLGSSGSIFLPLAKFSMYCRMVRSVHWPRSSGMISLTSEVSTTKEKRRGKKRKQINHECACSPTLLTSHLLFIPAPLFAAPLLPLSPSFSLVLPFKYLFVRVALSTKSSQERSVRIRKMVGFTGTSLLANVSYEKVTMSPGEGISMNTFSGGTVNMVPFGLY